MRETISISHIRRVTSTLSLAARQTVSLAVLLAVTAAVTASCSRNGDAAFPQEAAEGDFVHVELQGTKAGGDYTATTYRIIMYGQPDQTKSDRLLYVTDGSYCAPKGGTHTWLTPCSINDTETGTGHHRYVYNGEDVQAGVVFMHDKKWFYDSGKKQQWYYSYNQNAYKMAIASAGIPVTMYEDTVYAGDIERVEPCCALVIRRDIGDGDRVAVSSGLRDVTVSASYAGGSYVYTVSPTALYERRARLMVEITCDPLIAAGADITGVRMRDVLEEAYYRPDRGTYDRYRGQKYSEDAILYKEIEESRQHIMPGDDPLVVYGGDDVFLIAKDYSEKKEDAEGHLVSACRYPVLEVCLGHTWIQIPLDVNMEYQHNYYLRVVINKVHVTAEMTVLAWDVMEPAADAIDEYPSYYLGTVSLLEWDDGAGGPTDIDGLTPGQVYGKGDTGKDPWDTGDGSGATIENQQGGDNVTGKGGDKPTVQWENGGGGTGEI